MSEAGEWSRRGAHARLEGKYKEKRDCSYGGASADWRRAALQTESKLIRSWVFKGAQQSGGQGGGGVGAVAPGVPHSLSLVLTKYNLSKITRYHRLPCAH